MRGDLVAVGASAEDGAAPGVNPATVPYDANSLNSGGVYVFRVGPSSWTQIGHVKASSLFKDDAFGQAIALGPDFMVVGAPGDDGTDLGVLAASGARSSDTTLNSGAVYVFH